MKIPTSTLPHSIRRYAFLGALALAGPLSAQISLTGPYSENFDTAFAGGATAIPAGWSLYANAAVASLAVSDGGWAGSATGYNAALQTNILATGDSVTDRCLAVYATNATETRYITASFVNNTGGVISELAFSFQLQASAARYDNTAGQPRFDGFRLLIDPENDATFADTAYEATITNDVFAFAGDTNYNTLTPNLWNATANGWATSAMLTAPGANTATVSGTITGLSIANGATFKLRWNSHNGGGTDPTAVVGYDRVNMNIGVDDLTITPTVDVPTTVPPDPSGLAATTVGSQSIGLTWVDNSATETGFKIQRSLTTGGPIWTDVVTTAANATSYTDTGLSPGTEYFYQVFATNGIGDSVNPTNEASATTTAVNPGTVQLTAATYSASESAGTVTISVERIGGADGAVSIDYATSDGTATTGGSDYVATSGTLNWANGDSTTKSFDVTINNDTTIESDEDFTVTLSTAGGGVTLGSPDSAVVTITNDDNAGTVKLTSATYSVGEGGTVTVSVERVSGVTGAVSIDYATSDGTATTADSDYVATSGTLNWADAESGIKTFDVTITDDSNVESDEDFSVTLSNAGGGITLGSPDSAVVTITNDDFVATAIVVTPSDLTVLSGETQQFSAVLNDQNGDPIDPQPTFTWSVTGDSIDTNGLFTAGASAGGPYTVSAEAASLTGTTTVTVSSGVILINETWAGYTDNANLNGVSVQSGTGLTGNWAVTNASAGVGAQNNGAGDTKTYTAGAGATEFTFSGNYAEPLNDFQDAVLSAAPTSAITGDVYFRFSFFLSSLPTAVGATDSGIWMNLGADKIGFYNNVNPSKIFVGTTAGGGTTSDFTMTAGTVNAIVGKLTYSGGVYTSATVWLNPTSNQASDLAALGTKIEGAALTAGLTQISTLSFGWEDRRTGSQQGLGAVRLGKTFSDIGIVASSPPVYTAAEEWRNTYFGSPANSGDGADTNDFDKDGLVNLLERAFQTDPTDSASSTPPTQSTVTDTGIDYLAISYRRVAGGIGTTGVDYTVEGMTYTVEYDADLVAPWSSGSVVAVGSPVDNADGTETVTVRLTTPISGAAKDFMRLRVISTP